MAIAEHLVATTRGGDRSLVWPEQAGWLWERLRANFEDALSLVVMPDHVHLVAMPAGVERVRRVFAAFTVRFGVRFDVLEPQPANSPEIAGRMMRYGFFNPLRDRLVEDPWAWPWSTLRDLGGAVYPVWTRLSSVTMTLGLSAEVALRTLTTIGGRAAPVPRPQRVEVASLDVVRSAVASALRIQDVAVRTSAAARRLFVQACRAIGDPPARKLAEVLGCGERSLRRYRSPVHPGLEAVMLCLGDERLRRVLEWPLGGQIRGGRAA